MEKDLWALYIATTHVISEDEQIDASRICQTIHTRDLSSESLTCKLLLVQLDDHCAIVKLAVSPFTHPEYPVSLSEAAKQVGKQVRTICREFYPQLSHTSDFESCFVHVPNYLFASRSEASCYEKALYDCADSDASNAGEEEDDTSAPSSCLDTQRSENTSEINDTEGEALAYTDAQTTTTCSLDVTEDDREDESSISQTQCSSQTAFEQNENILLHDGLNPQNDLPLEDLPGPPSSAVTTHAEAILKLVRKTLYSPALENPESGWSVTGKRKSPDSEPIQVPASSFGPIALPRTEIHPSWSDIATWLLSQGKSIKATGRSVEKVLQFFAGCIYYAGPLLPAIRADNCPTSSSIAWSTRRRFQRRAEFILTVVNGLLSICPSKNPYQVCYALASNPWYTPLRDLPDSELWHIATRVISRLTDDLTKQQNIGDVWDPIRELSEILLVDHDIVRDILLPSAKPAILTLPNTSGHQASATANEYYFPNGVEPPVNASGCYVPHNGQPPGNVSERYFPNGVEPPVNASEYYFPNGVEPPVNASGCYVPHNGQPPGNVSEHYFPNGVEPPVNASEYYFPNGVEPPVNASGCYVPHNVQPPVNASEYYVPHNVQPPVNASEHYFPHNVEPPVNTSECYVSHKVQPPINAAAYYVTS